MRQAVMTAPGQIEFRNMERPTIADDQVLIQVRRIGICGSDIHVFHGRHPYTRYPVVQGHEVAGVVAEVGCPVEELSPGAPVTFMPQITCGQCYPCTHGQYHICESLRVMGFQAPGAAQEFFPVAAEKLLTVPARIPLEQVALVEPVAVAVHALARAGVDLQGQKVAVLGAGTIGNLVAQVAKASGAAAVLIADISDYKLEKARACGIDWTVHTGQEDLGSVIRPCLGPDRADLILECVGAPETMAQAVANARPGTTIVVVGVFGEKPVVDLDRVQVRELRLVGTLMYQRPDYQRAIELVASGQLHLAELITHRFPFAEYQQAYEAIVASQGRYMKVLIALD